MALEVKSKGHNVKRLLVVIFAVILTLTALVVYQQKTARAQKPKEQTPSGDTRKEEVQSPMMVSFTDLKWRALPERPGMQFTVLSGDPKTGAYMQMRKVPGGTDNALHSHSNELKNVIISGVWYTGTNAASAKDFGPGSIVIMPGNWVHVSGCRADSDCVFYQEGKGKFDFKASKTKSADVKP